METLVMTYHISDLDPEKWATMVEFADELAAQGYNARGAAKVFEERFGVTQRAFINWVKDGRFPKFKKSPTHLKGRSPDDWIEIERLVAEAALRRVSLGQAYRTVRHFGVTQAGLRHWVDAGIITSYKKVAERKILPQVEAARDVLARLDATSGQ